MSTMECDVVQKFMSPFIDSMVSASEAERVETHVAQCGPCRRQLQSFISMRSLVARVEAPKPPEDMVLETRVKLSHARNDNFRLRFENRLSNVFKPLVAPVLLGASLTMLLFGVLLGSLASASTVLAQDKVQVQEPPSNRLFQRVRADNRNWFAFASAHEKNDFDEPITIETHVSEQGRVIDYQILSGSETPEVDGFIREILSLAQFSPAMAFGRPVESKIILSFVAVRN
jgi:anti-sigma factor RsiW